MKFVPIINGQKQTPVRAAGPNHAAVKALIAQGFKRCEAYKFQDRLVVERDDKVFSVCVTSPAGWQVRTEPVAIQILTDQIKKPRV